MRPVPVVRRRRAFWLQLSVAWRKSKRESVGSNRREIGSHGAAATHTCASWRQGIRTKSRCSSARGTNCVRNDGRWCASCCDAYRTTGYLWSTQHNPFSLGWWSQGGLAGCCGCCGCFEGALLLLEERVRFIRGTPLRCIRDLYLKLRASESRSFCCSRGRRIGRASPEAADRRPVVIVSRAPACESHAEFSCVSFAAAQTALGARRPSQPASHSITYHL